MVAKRTMNGSDLACHQRNVAPPTASRVSTNKHLSVSQAAWFHIAYLVLDRSKDRTSQTSIRFFDHSTRLSNSEHFNFPHSDILGTREKYCPVHSCVVLVKPANAGSETVVVGVAMIAGITVIQVGIALVKQ
jgi:hypothetical protein